MFISNENTFISLGALANHFNLPKDYLRELADKSLIPFLNVKGHRRFNPSAVQVALDRLAEEKAGETDGR
jgi:hypothetical protein